MNDPKVLDCMRKLEKALALLKLFFVVIAAPFFIAGWCLMNPRKVWEQAKKDWRDWKIL